MENETLKKMLYDNVWGDDAAEQTIDEILCRAAEKERKIAIRDRALYRACQGDGNAIQAFMDAGREDLEADEQLAQEEK